MPHLSPRPSEEPTPTLSLEQKRHKPKRSSFLFGTKDKPDMKPHSVDTYAPITLTEASGSHTQGPNLRLLPHEDGPHQQTDAEVPSKLDRYIPVPNDPTARNTLHPMEDKKTRYEWDYVMEHQRGFRFLSTPLFSQAGLLPSDPPPFATIGPDPIPCSLEDFQLPSPEWRWVGNGWCVDMRGDGEVQEDGFEYNWWFRRKGWRPRIGFWSSGAYVRRRRWMRLRCLTPPEPISEKPTVPTSSARSPEALAGWEKLRAKMMETELDRERLEMVKTWLDESTSNEDLLRKRWTETLNMFVFPSSRDLLRSMVRSMGWDPLPDGDKEAFWKEAA
ncbi:hypothetical protein CALVIDRAFT_540016 [Calocera viscosa TUFC12733]|uniref:Peroxin domain-containing protein n=1 Tax=Calocera viscosa (strain TUFC12733) TaxID=1330018 RepID=A0A167JG87_CALVF|nr:hypothetical protein CALVIDRAFT_540016 [Calocera viscosa TUFC12733]